MLVIKGLIFKKPWTDGLTINDSMQDYPVSIQHTIAGTSNYQQTVTEQCQALYVYQGRPSYGAAQQHQNPAVDDRARLVQNEVN